MITVTDVQYHTDLPFEDYLRLPATSFSGLKEAVIIPTAAMHLGTLVHRYLLKPAEYNYEQYDIVKPIALRLLDFVTPAILRRMVAEQPITATFTHAGFAFKWKGVPDLQLPYTIVIDFKIISGSLRNYMERMNSANQVRGYALPVNAPMGLLIAYNKLKRAVEVETVTQDTRWWETIIISRGTYEGQKETARG